MTMYRTEQTTDIEQSITVVESVVLTKAAKFYNKRLFNDSLPDCLVLLNRKCGANGYFRAASFEKRDGTDIRDEISLNPDTFSGRTDTQILSTLVHELCHQWQFHQGKPSRGGYHNEEWASRMESVGLAPSHTGQPGGRRTGQGVTHYIVEGGPFDLATADLLATGWRLNWQSPAREKKPKDNSKTKYTCNCGQAAWGKPGLAMVCALCAGAFLPADNPMARPMFILQPLTDDEYRRQCEAQGLFIGGSRDLGGEADNDDLAEGAA